MKDGRPIRDADLSLLLVFHGMADRYGWLFSETEKELDIKLTLHPAEIMTKLRGIYAGEAKYYKETSKK